MSIVIASVFFAAGVAWASAEPEADDGTATDAATLGEPATPEERPDPARATETVVIDPIADPTPHPSSEPALATAPAAELRAAAHEPSAPPPHRKTRTYDRRGAQIALSTGITSCAAMYCADFGIGGIGRIEVGYRFPHVAVFATSSVAGAELDLERETFDGDRSEGSVLFVDAGVGAHVYLLPSRFVDPYVGAMLGYFRATRRERDPSVANGDERKEWLSRGVFRPTVGFDFLVAEHFAIGPRFDIMIPFAGSYCTEDVFADASCTDIGELVDMREFAEDRRAFRRLFPKPWSLTVQARLVF